MQPTQMATRDLPVPATGPSHFLELPLEIRRQIYDSTIGLCLPDQLSLLSTNHQVYDEACDFLFQRPLTFSSRQCLESFVDNHRSDILGRVRNLRLRLGEVDPVAMESYLRKAIMGTPVCAGEHPFVLESERILSCLRTMPSIRHFSLLPSRHRNWDWTPRELVHCLLTQMPQHLKQLESLSICTDLKSIDFLADMSSLRSLRFSGCSETTSQSARLIMKQMSCMQELVIIGPSKAFLKRQKCRLQKGAMLAITPDVLCNLQPLKRLTIRDLNPSSNPIFFTERMLSAIFDTHRTTLQSLCISSLSQPSNAVQGVLKTILMSSPMLRELQLEWPNMETDLLSDCVPSTLQSLTVAVRNRTHGKDVIGALTSASIRLPHLRDVQLNMIDATIEQQMHHMSVDDPQVRGDITMPPNRNESTRCTTPRWRISWGKWHPAGDGDV